MTTISATQIIMLTTRNWWAKALLNANSIIKPKAASKLAL